MHLTISSLITTLLVLFNLTHALPLTAPSDLETRQSLNPVRNDLSGSCKPITILYARGTAELGNVGLLAGPPFFNALGAMVGYSNIAVQGVDYPADIPGYLLGGSSSGTKTLAALLGTAVAKCPSSQIVIGGYR
jgi:cutinase